MHRANLLYNVEERSKGDGDRGFYSDSCFTLEWGSLAQMIPVKSHLLKRDLEYLHVSTDWRLSYCVRALTVWERKPWHSDGMTMTASACQPYGPPLQKGEKGIERKFISYPVPTCVTGCWSECSTTPLSLTGCHTVHVCNVDFSSSIRYVL